MKRRRRFTCKRMSAVLLALALLCGGAQTAAAEVKAAEGAGNSGDYKYTIRLFAGQQGTFKGSDKSVTIYSDIEAGSRITLPSNRELEAQIDPEGGDSSKYYIKGIRKSGQDNNTSSDMANLSFEANGDVDYVVAYGIKGHMVPYTVNYVDRETREPLAESEEYYGNVGDDPIVAFLYIEGYQPQAYNLTKKLTENAADNVFTFEYTRIEGTATPTPAPEGEAGGEGEGGAAAGGAAGAAGAAGEAGADAGLPLTEVPDQGVPLADGPQDLIDLDEEDTPLANLDLNGDGEPDGILATGIRLGLIGASAALLGFLLFLFYKRRKQEKEAEAIVRDERDHS